MYTFDAMKPGYANLWRAAEVKETASAARIARSIVADRERYERVGERIGHSELWPLIGAIHDREGARSFNTHLHNGDSLQARTHHVPAGRPPSGNPPFTWEESAEDALRLKGWHNIHEWPLERWLFESERYNGWGYLGKINSPYVWAGTTKQQRGKFVRDGVYDASVWDTQLGIAAILKAVFDFVPESSPLSDVPPSQPIPTGANELVKYLEVNFVILTKEQFNILLQATRNTK